MAGKVLSRTLWRAKLERAAEARIVPVPPKMQRQWGAGTMLIPRGADVEAAVREIPKGRLATVNQIRALLARGAGADTACPMVTGILLRIAAEAAEEDARAGRKRITPYWRVLREGGRCNQKYPGGVAAQTVRLQSEGHRVEGGWVLRFEKDLVVW